MFLETIIPFLASSPLSFISFLFYCKTLVCGFYSKTHYSTNVLSGFQKTHSLHMTHSTIANSCACLLQPLISCKLKKSAVEASMLLTNRRKSFSHHHVYFFNGKTLSDYHKSMVLQVAHSFITINSRELLLLL